MNPIDVERVALWWGPGILVLVIFGYGFMRLAHYWIEKSMEVKRHQMESAYGVVRQYIEQYLTSQGSQADALSRLANSVEHRESLESFEHQEILIALKAMHRDFNGLYCRHTDPACAVRDALKAARSAPELRELPAGERIRPRSHAAVAGRRLSAVAASRPELAAGEASEEEQGGGGSKEVACAGSAATPAETSFPLGQAETGLPDGMERVPLARHHRLSPASLPKGVVDAQEGAAASARLVENPRPEALSAVADLDLYAEPAAVGPGSIHPFAGNTYIKNISLGVK